MYAKPIKKMVKKTIMVLNNEKIKKPSRDIFMWIIKIRLKLKNHIQGVY